MDTKDIGGSKGVPYTHTWPIISSISCIFGKFGKIVCWRPLLRGILDPPLKDIALEFAFVRCEPTSTKTLGIMYTIYIIHVGHLGSSHKGCSLT